MDGLSNEPDTDAPSVVVIRGTRFDFLAERDIF
jgi:hypothetical protein